jgi:hypothetical protein
MFVARRLPDRGCEDHQGYKLPARFIIHTVGPVWHGGHNGEPRLLAGCYRRSLELASANGVQTIAFPSISTGIYGYPIEEAAKVAVASVRETLARMNSGCASERYYHNGCCRRERPVRRGFVPQTTGRRRRETLVACGAACGR